MTVFEYRAINASGKLYTGTMEAATPADVRAQLDRSGITPISTTEKKAGRGWRDSFTLEPGSEDITGFTLDLAMLLSGGASLDEALVILTQMETRRWLVRMIKELHVGISSGKNLSAVLSEHPRHFPPIYVKMIEVAEVSGRLEKALLSIAEERQRSERLRRRVLSAVTYPAFLAVAALGVLVFVLLYLVPQFEGAIEGFRDKIDPSALVVFGLSEWLRANLDILLIVLIVTFVGFVALKKFGEKRSWGIILLSRLPVTGQIILYNRTLTFCRTLQILLENGVDISTSLRLIKGVTTIPSVADKIDGVIAAVRGGARLSQALAKQQVLPNHVVQMLRVGEESGQLASGAGRIAGFYEVRLDAALSRLTAVMGPALMMLVSLLIGWLILSIMSALMSINDVLV